MNEETGSELMADAILDGYPEGMRAVDQADIRGGGFDIVCVGESPRFWFRGSDERGLYEWLRERRNVHAKNEPQQCMRWSDVSVEDSADGFILRSSDGAAIVHIREAGAGALLKWLGTKLAGDAAEGRGPSPEEAAASPNMDAGAGAKCEATTPLDECKPDDYLEQEHGGKLMRVAKLPAQYDDLKSWVGAKYGTHNILAVLSHDHLRLRWYTRDSLISVSVRLPKKTEIGCKPDFGYLGAAACSRAPRPGETWTRGNDLADGPHCLDTWRRIVADAAFWDVLPLRIPMTGENDAHNQSGYPADHPYVIPVRPDIPNGDRAAVGARTEGCAEPDAPWMPAGPAVPVTCSSSKRANGYFCLGDGTGMYDLIVDLTRKHLELHVAAAFGFHVAEYDLPGCMCDMRTVLPVDSVTGPAFSYPSDVEIGGAVYNVNRITTPKYVRNMRDVGDVVPELVLAVGKMAGDYAEEVANRKRSGAGDTMFTRPSARVVRDGEMLEITVYGFVFQPLVAAKSGGAT